MRKTLIFGGTGFIGRNVANYLASNHNEEVIVFDNNFRDYSNFSMHPSIRRVIGDITSPNDIIGLFDGVHTVYNLAYINGTKNFYSIPGEVLRVAGYGALNVIEGIVKSRTVERYIYFSSSEAYVGCGVIPTPEDVTLTVTAPENPRFSYGGGKIFGELTTNHCLPDHICRYIIRPHNIFGPNMGDDHVIPQLVKKLIVATSTGVQLEGGGQTTRAFCYIDDFVHALCEFVVKGPSGTYNIGSSDEISILSLYDKICALLGNSPPAVPVPLPKGSVDRRCPDLKKLFGLGYRELVGWKLGLERTVAWYRSHYGD